MNSVASLSSSVSETEFAVRRNDFLNDFARFEAAVCSCLRKFTTDFDGKSKPFTQRLKDVAQAQPSPDLPKNAAKVLAGLPARFEAELRIRASLVHGWMEIGTRGCQSAAFFHNAIDQAQNLPIYLVMTKEDFDATQRKLKATTAQLETYLRGSTEEKKGAAA